MVTALALVVGLVAGAFAAGWVVWADGRSDFVPSAAIPVDSTRDDAPASPISRIADAVLPTVVSLEVQGPRRGATGSGFVVRSDGYIVTNSHVISGAVDGGAIRVTFADGAQVPARIVGRSPTYDVAVVRVDRDNLPAVRLGDSAQLRVGDPLVVVGSPLGLSGTVTTGIVSALGRPVTTADGGEASYISAIQTDAAINPGNSGGPLVNLNGEVVGVNFAIESQTRQNSGVGFTIPVSIVKRVVPALIEDGAYKYAYLGLEGSTISAQLAEALELPDNTLGVYVSSVVPGGPSETGGVQGGNRTATTANGVEVRQGGDIVTAIDDMPVVRFEDLVSYLVTKAEPGKTVTLTIQRGGEEIKVDVTLGERPTQSVAATERGENGRINARAAIAIAEDAVRNDLTGEITEKVATPDERDGQDVWVVELSTATQTATVVVDSQSGDVLDVTIE